MHALFDARHLATNDLAVEVLRGFGALRLGVTGSSMLPAIRPADTILVHPCSFEDAELHDIVLFTRQRRLFAHRVVSRSAAHLITQGDGLAGPDHPVTADELLGKVVQVTRRGKPVRHTQSPDWSSRLAGALFRRSPLAGRLFTRAQSLPGRAGL